jgi:hypothetical protein
MLICEDSLERAIKVFLDEARMPRPDNWSLDKDKSFIDNCIVPAFFEALKQIESVETCYGFDLSTVKPYAADER